MLFRWFSSVPGAIPSLTHLFLQCQHSGSRCPHGKLNIWDLWLFASVVGALTVVFLFFPCHSQYSAVDSNPLSLYVMHPFWNTIVKVRPRPTLSGTAKLQSPQSLLCKTVS